LDRNATSRSPSDPALNVTYGTAPITLAEMSLTRPSSTASLNPSNSARVSSTDASA
jgi:hypothetical protein